MTAAEIERAFEQNRVDHRGFVRKELHDEVVKGLRDDMKEVKATLNKLIWAILALFFTVVGNAIVGVVRSGLP